MTYTKEQQLCDWVDGNPQHRHDTDECCPDFSCCHPDIDTPREVRERFAEAYRCGDEQTQHTMLMMFLGEALARYDTSHKVYIAGEPVDEQ